MRTPPSAKRVSHEHTEHGVRRSDPYHWMRERDSGDLLAHLVAERSWYEAATGHLDSLVEGLRSEMTGRVPATESSVRWRHQGCSYYTRLPAGRDHHQLVRELEPGGAGEVLLDVEELGDGSGYVELGVCLVSPDSRVLAYSVDTTGDEVYALRFRDLATGADLTTAAGMSEQVPRTSYGGAWTSASEAFVYTVHDEAYRPFQVWRHTLGTPAHDDVLVLEEPDERFELDVRASRSGDLVILTASSRDSREVWALDAHDPTAAPFSVGGRRPGVEYDAEHVVLGDGATERDALLLVTDDGAVEFRLARCPVPRVGHQDHHAWQPVRPEDPAERLERVDAFAGHVVLTSRARGRRRLRVLPLDLASREGPWTALAGPGQVVDPVHPGGTLALGRNDDPDATAVTVVDQSYVQPPVWFDLDLGTGERAVRHRQQAPGHDPDRYLSETLLFPAADGTPVPATLVRRGDTPLDGTAPALLYGYGAYEYSFEPEWDPALPSLLDRGVVFVHAHVRGGGEGGRRWWLDGRLEHKQHTFSDHLAVADGLAGGAVVSTAGRPTVEPSTGLVDGDRLATRGLSAGGLLQGAVLSQRPARWRAVVAEVPFVDVVTSMLDPGVPLTVTEWDEWGDPRRPEDFAWMRAYSPYDNLPPAGLRPDLLVTGALHDPRVMVTEPAKWVAALRHSDPEWSPRCLFRAETGAGAHVGPSGRFARLGYEAEVCAWLLDRLGAVEVS